MGFYPKHLRQRRYRRNMRIIATAGLSGCIFKQCGRTTNIPPWWPMGWTILYSDGRESRMYSTKSEAAAVYLIRWFQKQDMLPKRRIA